MHDTSLHGKLTSIGVDVLMVCIVWKENPKKKSSIFCRKNLTSKNASNIDIFYWQRVAIVNIYMVRKMNSGNIYMVRKMNSGNIYMVRKMNSGNTI